MTIISSTIASNYVFDPVISDLCKANIYRNSLWEDGSMVCFKRNRWPLNVYAMWMPESVVTVYMEWNSRIEQAWDLQAPFFLNVIYIYIYDLLTFFMPCGCRILSSLCTWNETPGLRTQEMCNLRRLWISRVALLKNLPMYAWDLQALYLVTENWLTYFVIESWLTTHCFSF